MSIAFGFFFFELLDNILTLNQLFFDILIFPTDLTLDFLNLLL